MSESESLTVPLPPTMTAAPTRARHVVLLFTILLAAVAYLDRVCISTAASHIKSDLRLDDAQMGYVYSAFTLAYALCEVPSGWLADRFGARLMLTRIVLWWSLMTAATGWVGGFASLFLVRLLFGMGEAGTFPGISRVYGRWLPERVRGSAFGLAVMTGAVGGAITQPLVVWLLGVTTWRHCFEIFGLVGAVWATAWWWWFRDDPHRHASVNAAELEHIGSDAPTPHPPVPWAQVVRSRSLALLCLMYFGTIYGWYFYLTWLPSYLQRARGFDLKHAGWLSALPYLGIAAGVMAGGWLSDTLQRRWGARIGRRVPGLVGLPLAACAVIGAINTSSPFLAAVLFACAACLAALGVAAGWALCLDIGGRHVGVVSGAMNMFGNLGGAVSPVVIGLCLKQWDSWNAPLYTVAAFYLVAAGCWLGIDPCQTINSETTNRRS